MTIKETGATRPKLPGTNDINYAWTDIVLRRRPADIAKPLAEQTIKLSVRCVGHVDGADEPDPDESVSVSLTTEYLMGLSSALRTKIKAFIALCEKAAKKTGQTHTDDFTL